MSAPRLFLVVQPGCHTCRLSKPRVLSAAAELRLPVTVVDITVVDWRADWTPTLTPAMILSDGRKGKAKVREGFVNSKEEALAWLRQNL